jgi:retron-type reverse transcriptase
MIMLLNTFIQKKGLRQGGLLSPMLFNIVVDMLAILIERAKIDGQIEGVVPHLVDGDLSILKYADDTNLFMDHDLDKAKNLKLILSGSICQVLKLISIKVNCFVLESLKTRLTNMPNFSDVG